MQRARAFTLIELLTVMAIMAALISLSMPTLSRTREEAKRTVCMANERGIGHAFYLYAMNAPDPGVFPMIAQPTTDGAFQIFNTRDRTVEPSTTGAPSPTVDMWAVVRVSYALPKQYICPSTNDVPDPVADTTVYYDFLSAANLSYAYQYQHDPNRRTIGMASEPVFPVLADANPYIKGGIPLTGSLSADRTGPGRGNSLNHMNREGQNVLLQDGHVEFEKGPDVGLSGKINTGAEKVSRGRDNCYTTHTEHSPVDWGDAKPVVTGSPGAQTGICNLGDKSDACLIP